MIRSHTSPSFGVVPALLAQLRRDVTRLGLELAVARARYRTLSSDLTRQTCDLIAASTAITSYRDALDAADQRLSRAEAVLPERTAPGPNDPRWRRQGGDDAGGNWRMVAGGTLR